VAVGATPTVRASGRSSVSRAPVKRLSLRFGRETLP